VFSLVLGTLLISSFVWAFQLPASSEAVDLNPPKKLGGKPRKLKPQLQLVETALENYAKNIKALEAALTAAETRIRSLETRQQGGNGLTEEDAEILSHMSLVFLPDGEGGFTKTLRFTGVNIQIVNGLGATNGNPADPGPDHAFINGVGNLIVGYNEQILSTANRTGSHNVIVGTGHDYVGYGSLLSGVGHIAIGQYSSAIGGLGNSLLGAGATITGGEFNNANGKSSSISGGTRREVNGDLDWRAGDLFQDQ
jgi:hypothetical protein